MRQFLPLLFLLLFVFVACEKEAIDNSDKNFPIELSIEATGQLIELNWTATNISTFEEYLVVRSFDSIPNGISPFSNFLETKIDDYEENFFSTAVNSFEESVFYKVYVDIGDRFLESPSVNISQEILSFDFSADRAIYDEKQDAFFFYSFSQSRLSRFDVSKNEISHEVEGITNFQDLVVGDYNGKRELYVSNKFNGVISIYDAATLELIDDFSIGQRVNALLTNNRGLLFLSTSFTSGQMRVVSRADFSEKVSVNNFNSASERRLLMIDAETNELIEATSFDLYYYRFAENGSLEEFRTGAASGNLYNNIAVNSDKTHFIPYRDGQVFNMQLDLEIFPGFFGDDISGYVWNKNGDAVTAGFSFFGFVQSFSFPDFDQGELIDLSLDRVQFLFPFDDNDFAYVIGPRDFGANQKFFIRTVALP